jgi:hypothetical protein
VNLMQVMALMGQGGGAIGRTQAGPLAARMPRPGAGPLAIGGGTMAQQQPQPLERIDPGADMAASMTAGNSMTAPAPAGMMKPEISPETWQMAASMPLRGPLAPEGMTVAGQPAAPAAPAQRRGVFSRIGDFMGSDEGRGAFLRGGAQLLSGGSLGDAVSAGANFVDARRRERIGLASQDREFGQRDRGLDIQQQGTSQQGLYQAGQLQNSANRNMIDMMEAEARAKQFAATQKLDWAKLSLAERELLVDTQMAYMLEEGRNQRHATVSGSTAYASDSATARNDKTIAAKDGGGDNLGKIVTTTDAVKAEEPGWFSSGTPGKPEQRIEVNVRSLPPAKEQLVPGTVYATPQGNARWNGAAFETLE